jgi:hypothetical protein
MRSMRVLSWLMLSSTGRYESGLGFETFQAVANCSIE